MPFYVKVKRREKYEKNHFSAIGHFTVWTTNE